MIDEVRDYWNCRPCNIMHSLVDIDEDPLLYSQQVTARKYLVEPHIPRFAQFERWRGKRVLEIGCGIGTDALEFAAHGAYVTARDLSRASIEIAQKRAAAEVARLTGGLQFGVGNAERLRLSEGFYDLVYSFGVIHHTPNPSLVIRQVRALLAPGGEFRLMLYHRYSWRVLCLLRQWWYPWAKIDKVVARASEAQGNCPVVYTYTKRSARKLLEGFKIVDMRVEHIFPYRILDYINRRYIKEWYWEALPQKVFRWLERHIGWHLLIVARKA